MSTTSTPRPTGSNTCSRRSLRRGSTARSASRRTTRTVTRSRTPSSSGRRPLVAEKPALERLEQLLTLEPLGLGGAAILRRDADVVLQGRVGLLDGVLQLVALEDV